MRRLSLFLVVAQRVSTWVSTCATADHFAPDLLKAAVCIALALIDQLHGGFRTHRPANCHWVGALADCLIDEILIVLAAADAPSEADGSDRAGADLGVAIGFRGRDRRRAWFPRFEEQFVASQ